MTRKCGICQHQFEAKRKLDRYCSVRCSHMALRGEEPKRSMLPADAIVNVSFRYTHSGTCTRCGNRWTSTVKYTARRSITRRKLCDDCLRKLHRDLGRKNNAVVKLRNCKRCGVEIVGQTRKSYCEECYRKQREDSRRKYYGKSGSIDPKWLRGPRWENRLAMGGDRISCGRSA